jgi:hypothetical protein
MPNWVSNSLQAIKGDPKEVFDLIRTEQSVFAFNNLVPMPEHIKNCDEEVDLAGFKVTAWYKWSLQNWGTKWNAREAKYSTKDPEHVVWFDTAWAPPVPVFESPAKQFPSAAYPSSEVLVEPRLFEATTTRNEQRINRFSDQLVVRGSCQR